jgi:dTDP-D-glucose 4,6-dehydratase
VIDLVRTLTTVAGKGHLEPVVQATDLSQKGYFEHLSDEKMRTVVGWSPRLRLEDGLRLTYDWYHEHGSAWIRP